MLALAFDFDRLIVFPAMVVYTTLVNKYNTDLDLGLRKLRVRKHNIFTFLFIAAKEVGRFLMRHSTTVLGHVSVTKFTEHSLKLTFHLMVMLCYMWCISFITWESYSSLRSPPDGTFMTTR